MKNANIGFVDNYGRVAIPRHILDGALIENGSIVKVNRKDDKIVITPYQLMMDREFDDDALAAFISDMMDYMSDENLKRIQGCLAERFPEL